MAVLDTTGVRSLYYAIGFVWSTKDALFICALDSVDCIWSAMAHAQKTDFVFRRNGRVHLNRRGLHFSRVLVVEVCAAAVVMLDTPCSEVVWRVLVTHSIRQFPLHFPSRASPCAITFQLDSTTVNAGFPCNKVSVFRNRRRTNYPVSESL